MKNIVKKLFIGLALLSAFGVYGQTPKTDAQLTTQSNIIRDETVAGGNTKTRIAAMYQALIDSKINVSQLAYVVATGTDTYAGTITPTPSTYTALRVFVYFDNANTGAATINFNSLGVVNIVNNDGSAMSSGDIGDNEVKLLVYNGTNFQCVGGGVVDLSTTLLKDNNLSDLTNAVTARTNLGLGTLATQSGTFSGTSSGTNTGDQDISVKSDKLFTQVTYTSNHTLDFALDLDKRVVINTTSGNVTLTIPTNAAQAFPVDYQLVILHIDTNPTPNTLTIAASGGVTISASNSALTSPLSAAGSTFLYASKRATDTWDLANGTTLSGITALTGAVTGSGTGSVVTTLADVNGNVGTFGSATAGITAAVNSKGLITSISTQTITPAVGSITGFGTGVGTWLATPSWTNFNSAITGTSPFWNTTGSTTVTTPTITGKITYTQASESSTNTFQTFTQAAHTGGSPVGLLFTGGASTTLTASTEATDINFDLARTVQFSTGALATQRAVRIKAPTYSFVGASTITDATTFDIDAAPVAGTNATITRGWSMRTGTGNVRMNGRVSIHATATDGFNGLSTNMFFVGLASDASESAVLGNLRIVNETDGNPRISNALLTGYVSITGDNLVGNAANLLLYGRNNTTNRRFSLNGGIAANDTDVGVNYNSVISGTSMGTSNTTNVNGGSLLIYGGAKATAGTSNGNIILAHNGSSSIGSVVVGGSSLTHASAKVDIQSTTQGFLPPRMTKTQRDAISSPTTGLMIYQTDNTPGLRVWNGTNWMRYTETAD